MINRDPLNQLTALRIDVDQGTRARDLEAIRADLRRVAGARPAPRRRWALGVVLAMMLAGPGAAVASDGAVPGDLLYPVKRAVEPIVQLFDSDVVAEHRVEEVERLIDRKTEDALIEQQLEIARDALAETDAPLLEDALERAVDRWVSERSTPPRTDQPAPTTVPRRESVRDQTDRDAGPAVSDALESTTTTIDRPIVTRPTERRTTSTAPSDDRQPPDDRPRDNP